MLSNSTWDREGARRQVSSAFTYGRSRVVFEFENRQTTKIFSHRLGRVQFTDGLDERINSGRNEQIEELYGTKSVDGYTYKSISHVHVPPVLLPPNLLVYGHGAPVKGGYENCVMIGAECGEGADTKCEVGKCEVGRLVRVEGDKWRYESLTVPGLYYFVYGTERVELRSIVRGRVALPAGAGTVAVSRVASVPATVYLPPSTYSAETFTRRVITSLDQTGNVRSLTDTVDNFIRSLLGLNQATVRAEVEVRDRLLTTLRGVLDPAWYGFVEEVIGSVWNDRFTGTDLTNRDFLIRSYNELSDLYGRGVQVMLSGLRGSRVEVDNSVGRPVYERLPGVEGKYNDGEGGDTVAKWLTAGADDVLSGSKTLIDTFYRDFLDPETCYPLNLDWLAQHLGFTGPLWDIEWSSDVKRLLLSNAHVNRLPEGGMWTKDAGADTVRSIDFGRIERVNVNELSGTVSTVSRYVKKSYDSDTDITSLVPVTDLVVDSSAWNGIFPSRGNLTTLLFMFWAFGIKAHSPEEMIYSAVDNTFSVRSGLRSAEVTAPVNTPYMVDVLRVGNETDAETGNYPNQLIADIGTCQDETSANTVVVRMPFYYNRNGKSWDAARVVVDNYIPSTSISRLQYAYSAADLLVADDIFFEPETIV